MKIAKIFLSLIIVLSIAIPSASVFASEKVTVAVLPFENAGVFERFDYLRTLLPLFLTTALVDIPEISLVKRTDIQALLAEKELGLDGLTAEELKKVLGADILIKGTFEEKPIPGEDVTKARLIINFSLEETTTGKTIAAQEIKGSVDHLEETIKETVNKVFATLSVDKSIAATKTGRLSHLEAIKYFQEAREIIKNYNTADYAKKDDEKALELFRRAAFLLPEWDEAWYEVGERLEALNTLNKPCLDEAYEAFERALKLTSDPDLAAGAMLNQGHIWFFRYRCYRYGPEALRSIEESDKALAKSQQVYIKMAKTYPHYPDAHNALINALNAPQFAQNPEVYKLAIEAGIVLMGHFEKHAGVAQYRIGEYLLCLKRPQEALDYLKPFLESTHHPRTLFHLSRLIGQIYEKNLNDIDKAVVYYQKALNLCLNEPTIDNWHAKEIVISVGKYFESKREWEKAASLYTDYLKKLAEAHRYEKCFFYKRLGYCFEKLGYWGKALDAYREADLHDELVREGIERCQKNISSQLDDQDPVLFWMEDENILECIGKFPRPPSDRTLGIGHTIMLFTHGRLWLGFGPLDDLNAMLIKNMKEAGSPWKLSVIRYNFKEGKTEKIFGKEQGLPSFGITCLAASPDYVWAGTIGGGLLRFGPEGENWKVYTTKDGLGNDHILALLVDKEHLWVGGGTEQAGILSQLSLANGKWSNYAAPEVLDCPITSLIDQGNYLLVGTAKRGFFDFKKETGAFAAPPYRLILKGSRAANYITRDIAICDNSIWWKGIDNSCLWSFNLKTSKLSSWQHPPVIEKAYWRFMTGLAQVDNLLLASFAEGDIGVFDPNQQEWQGIIASRTNKAIGIGHHEGHIYIATQNGKIKRLSEAALWKYLDKVK